MHHHPSSIRGDPLFASAICGHETSVVWSINVIPRVFAATQISTRCTKQPDLRLPLLRTASRTSPVLEQSSGIKKFFEFPDLPPNKLTSTTAEKEIGWFDVLGGDHPIKEYRKMQEQRELQAWFVEGEGGRTRRAHNAEQREGGSVAREGAPFHAPPSMAGPVSGKAKTPSFAASAAAGTPKVMLRSVRPKPTENRSKTAARGPRKNRARGKSQTI